MTEPLDDERAVVTALDEWIAEQLRRRYNEACDTDPAIRAMFTGEGKGKPRGILPA